MQDRCCRLLHHALMLWLLVLVLPRSCAVDACAAAVAVDVAAAAVVPASPRPLLHSHYRVRHHLQCHHQLHLLRALTSHPLAVAAAVAAVAVLLLQLLLLLLAACVLLQLPSCLQAESRQKTVTAVHEQPPAATFNEVHVAVHMLAALPKTQQADACYWPA
jgi:hypothetical protein